jgi:N-acetylglutamate synthase
VTLPATVEAIERATLAAVAPQTMLEIDGWLVGLDPGTIRRAASAVPLSHAGGDFPFEAIVAAFEARGLKPAFRIADAPGLETVRLALARHGYEPSQPTLVALADTVSVVGVTVAPPAEVAGQPDEAWASVFVGEGFDPVDGAHRVAALSRSPDAAYASVREAGRTRAVGVGAFGQGLASFHGMRTEMAARGRGLAGRVLAALGREALARGIGRGFLQVEEGNAPARALYARAGFETAWRYVYWSRPKVNSESA